MTNCFLRKIEKLIIKEENGGTVLGGLVHPRKKKVGHYYLSPCHHIVKKDVRDIGSKPGKIKRMHCIWCEAGENGHKWRKLPQ